MHDIEPFVRWQPFYVAAEDPKSPFFRRQYSEFYFTNKVYNYLVHPQWDAFGAKTLYCKVLFADYETGFSAIEFIGEWNDCLHNDIMYLKRKLLEPMMEAGIHKWAFICDNVLSFHGDTDDYYSELAEECRDNGGWVVMINTLLHVEEELLNTRLQYSVFFGDDFNEVPWRTYHPNSFCSAIEQRVFGGNRVRQLV